MDLLVNIDVDDLTRGERFYLDAFGFTVGRRFGTAGVELLGAGSAVYLLEKPGEGPATSSGQRRDYGRHWTPVHLDIVVTDIDAAVERARAAGAVLEVPVKASAWGKLAVMADPFGHGFFLGEFVGLGYDEIASEP